VVLKPVGGPVYEWLAGRLGALSNEHVRLAMPIRARDGSWTCEGWSATQWLVGDHPDTSRESALIAILDAGRVFHEMVAHLPRADCLDARSDSWAVADRVAWGELRLRVRPEFASTTRRLQARLGRWVARKSCTQTSRATSCSPRGMPRLSLMCPRTGDPLLTPMASS
jgi:hypothetical protein